MQSPRPGAPHPKAETEHQVRAQAQAIKARCSFDAFRNQQALLVPTGWALLVLAFAASRLGNLLPRMPLDDERAVGELLDKLLKILTKDLVETSYGETHVLSMVLFVVVLVAGVWVLSHAKGLREQFEEAHPQMEGRASANDLATARALARKLRWTSLGCAAGTALLWMAAVLWGGDESLTVAATIGGSGSPATNLLQAGGFICLAGCVWCLVRAHLAERAPSRFAYNCETLARRNLYAIDAEEPEPLRSLLLVEKHDLDRERLLGNLLLTAGLLLSGAWFVLPGFASPLWWLPAVAGLVLRSVALWRSQLRAALRFEALADREAQQADPREQPAARQEQ